jgi:hypothetical protein
VMRMVGLLVVGCCMRMMLVVDDNDADAEE